MQVAGEEGASANSLVGRREAKLGGALEARGRGTELRPRGARPGQSTHLELPCVREGAHGGDKTFSWV